MRDTKTIEKFLKTKEQKIKESNIFRNLRKEVNVGANGTQKTLLKKVLIKVK